MKRSILALSFAMCLVLVFFVLSFAVQVQIEDVPATANPDDTFTATVAISDVADLNAACFEIVFDHTVLEFDPDSVIDGLIGGTVIPLFAVVNIEDGRWRITEDVVGLAGASGSGYLCKADFTVIGSAGDSSDIDLENESLSDTQAHYIIADWQGAHVDVVGSPSTVTLTADPINVIADGASTSTLTATVKDAEGNNVADGTAVTFTTDRGTLGSNTTTKSTTDGVATATLTAPAERGIAAVQAQADSVSDYTAVFFKEAGGADVVDSKTEKTGTGDDEIDAKAEANTTVAKSGDGTPTITVAQYAENPGGPAITAFAGGYIDVHLDDTTDVTEVTICLYYPITVDESEVQLYWWDEPTAAWVLTDPQTKDTTDVDSYGGKVCTTVSASGTVPTLDDLEGTVFAGGVVGVGTEAVFRVTPEGNVLADGTYYGLSYETGSADVAEWVRVSEPVEPGDVLELDPDNPGHYCKSCGPCSNLVAGVVSTDPGIILGSQVLGSDTGLTTDDSRPPTLDSRLLTDDSRLVTDDSALLALLGIVPVKVTDEGGSIQSGDLLVASSTPGYAMRWDADSAGGDSCGLIGKALEALESGTGMIQMLLMR